MRYGIAALKVGGARSFPSRFHVVPRLLCRMVQRRSGAAPPEAKADLPKRECTWAGVNAASACVSDCF